LDGIIKRASHAGVVLRGDVEGEVEQRLALRFHERGEAAVKESAPCPRREVLKLMLILRYAIRSLLL
jgi:hypothetical protein